MNIQNIRLMVRKIVRPLLVILLVFAAVLLFYLYSGQIANSSIKFMKTNKYFFKKGIGAKIKDFMPKNMKAKIFDENSASDDIAESEPEKKPEKRAAFNEEETPVRPVKKNEVVENIEEEEDVGVSKEKDIFNKKSRGSSKRVAKAKAAPTLQQPERDSHYAKAQTYYSKKNYSLAVQEFEASLEQDNNTEYLKSMSHYFLAMIYENNLKNKNKAYKHWKILSERDKPPGPGLNFPLMAKNALKRLGKGK